VELPLIALFGATSSRQWGPYTGGRPCLVVEPPPDVARGAAAMRRISAAQVIQAFDRVRAQIEAR